MGTRVAVAGASGYAGGELLRLLAGHPQLEIAAVTAGSSTGKPVTAIHPNLTGHPAFDGKNFQPTDAGTLGDAELIFMALPHGESATLAEHCPTPGSSTCRPTSGSATRRHGTSSTATPATRAAGPTACRNYPAPKSRSAPPARSPRPAATPPRRFSASRRCSRPASSSPPTS